MSYVVFGAWNLFISAELPSGQPSKGSAHRRSGTGALNAISSRFAWEEQRRWRDRETVGGDGSTTRGFCFRTANDDKASLQHVIRSLFSILWPALFSPGLITSVGLCKHTHTVKPCIGSSFGWFPKTTGRRMMTLSKGPHNINIHILENHHFYNCRSLFPNETNSCHKPSMFSHLDTCMKWGGNWWRDFIFLKKNA